MGDHGVKPSFHHPPILVSGLALLIAACGMLLSTSGAQAAGHRGAVLVKDILRGHSSGSPSQLTNVAGTLFFTAFDRRHGGELWRSDGTRRGTRMVKDIRPGRANTPISDLTAVGRTLYFVVGDGHPVSQLWRTDGTARGTRMVKGVFPGSGWNYLISLTNGGGTLYFVVGGTQLWRSDGTEAGTIMLRGGSDWYVNSEMSAVGRIFYFSVAGPDGGLWRSDGTSAGTVLVKKLSPGDLTDFGGTLFFTASDGTQSGIWRSNGTEAGTTLVIPSRLGATFPSGLTVAGGALYFLADTTPGGRALWRSYGTDAGMSMLADVGPTPEGDGFAPQLTATGRTLYFVRNEDSGILLRTDSTPGGTKVLRSNLRPESLTAAGNKLFFAGTDSRHGQELWQSDGSRKGTRLVRDIRPGARSGRLQELTAVRKTLFFSAYDNRHGYELWRAGPKPK